MHFPKAETGAARFVVGQATDFVDFYLDSPDEDCAYHVVPCRSNQRA